MAQSVFVMFDRLCKHKKNHGCLTRKPQETSLDSAMFRSFLDDEHEAWMWDDVGRSSQQGDESWNNISDL